VSREQEFLNAVQKGDVTKAKELLKTDRTLAKAKNADGVSALLLASYHRHKEIVQALLATGVELDVFEASAIGQEDRVKALLKKDASLANAFAADGFTPLGLAAYFAQKAVAEMLVAGGARVNQAAKNPMKVMPLHSAVSSRQLEIARLLIEHGAEVNARQQGGVTALHGTAAHGQIELAKLLLSHGADVNAKMDDGSTALDLAVKNNQTEMADLLRKHGTSAR